MCIIIRGHLCHYFITCINAVHESGPLFFRGGGGGGGHIHVVCSYCIK